MIEIDMKAAKLMSLTAGWEHSGVLVKLVYHLLGVMHQKHHIYMKVGT